MKYYHMDHMGNSEFLTSEDQHQCGKVKSYRNYIKQLTLVSLCDFIKESTHHENCT